MNTKLPRDKLGRFFKGGTAYPNGRKECIVPDCHNPFRSGSGYCVKHISQIRLYGKVLEHTKFDPRPAVIEGDIAKIPLNINAKDGYAIVDKEFAWFDQWKWHLNKKSGYAKRNLKLESGRTIRISMHCQLLKTKEGFEVDHKNRHKLDNRMSNLRPATHSINVHNRPAQSNNTSGHKGVYWAKWANKWRAAITLNGKDIYAGYFTNIEDAVAARKNLEEKYGLCA